MALRTVHTHDGVGTGGSYVTKLLAVETLLHTSGPIVYGRCRAVAIPQDPLVDGLIRRHWRGELEDQWA